MPPPSTVDAWLNGRRFGIVIDAGSSGSRLQLYSWRDPRIVRVEEGPKSYYTLPAVGKGTENPEDLVFKIEPGISSFADNPEDVASYLAPLLNHAREHIPPSLQHETPIFLLATAGMRLLPGPQQDAILNAACDFIRFHSDFRVGEASAAGRCGANIRIISGEEEGLFGWVAVNYLMDQFTPNDDDPTTFGFLDMGGASTQIAFEPSEEERAKTKNLADVHLRFIGGGDIHHQVFVTTWLGYGTNQARERYVGKTIEEHEASSSNTDKHASVPDPCLPRNLRLSENSAYPDHDDAHSRREHTLVGTGSFEQCLQQVAPLLNKNAPCPDVPCLFNGVHVPQIDFSVSHFIGVSEYWYSSEHVFGLGGPYNFEEYEKAASEFCSRDWDDIMKQHETARAKGVLGGDGEVEEDGRVVDVDKWGEEVEISRLQLQCFKSAWLVNVLHDGIGLPRIVDANGKSRETSNDVKEKADEKGLGRPKPTMQSLDSIGDTSISWTLGKMVLEASRDIPPLSKDTPPLPDPVINPESEDAVGPVDANRGTDPVIPVLSPEQYDQELSYSAFLFYLGSLAVLFVIAFRLRHPIWQIVRPYVRSLARREVTAENDLEGGARYDSKNGHSSFLNPLISGLPLSPSTSRLLSTTRTALLRILVSFRSRPATPPSSSVPPGRHMYPSSPRASPTRSFSSPSLRNQNGSVVTGHPSGSPFGASLPSRSATPPAYRPDRTQLNGLTSPSLYSLPRSRNNSQMNLTLLVTRQPVSRSGSSGQQTPVKAFHDEE